MKIFLIWGFLGSGKTTFINRALRELTQYKRVVIIENEVGKNNIDASYLRSQSYDVVDMSAGCVCCTLRAELPIAIAQIEKDIAPDAVVIEPSGISQLNDLIPSLQPYDTGVIALADASRWVMLMKLNARYYRQQYALSNTVVITKFDIAPQDTPSAIEHKLLQVNPLTHIISDYASLSAEQWCELFEASIINRTKPSFVYLSDCGPRFTVSTVAVAQHSNRAEVLETLDQLCTPTTTGNVVRIKGFIKLADQSTIKVDSVLGEHTISDLNIPIDTDNTLTVISECVSS